MEQKDNKQRLFEIMSRLDKNFKPKMNEDVFVLWADRVNDNLQMAVKKAKCKGKSNKDWNDQYKQNAKYGNGTVFFIDGDNVADAKSKLTLITTKHKTGDNMYRLTEETMRKLKL